ncbi:hypothetical protein COL68_23625 [Bacillus wiedmannii]|uniref:AP2-like integrase N-terminal domain-containing protein n=1 Tax=Bacillus wiedmannii TaxID=1890302 RepID=A0A2B5P470_9BACI|nr:Arm DNA-binding domain-containing protein [Bacillus wiedmannii]PEI67611.1 hypothetical protein CN646_17630 [Bacillus wiedmannii]PEJ41618.1 hypothetical protein CN672_27980 [Bacillus wiedmannii]PEJ69165.1 hypothetical protein CN888_25675 [Bacillus wiedmannii]PEL19493.1 hypothetical protein CN599_08470 [Bacillus wiedmannii]PEM06669.1 hypothetical protein CN610_27285 [Bacillus wiedmannii]
MYTVKGHIIKRGSKYSFVLDIGPDPEPGGRRQRWFSGYKTKKEAQADKNESTRIFPSIS